MDTPTNNDTTKETNADECCGTARDANTLRDDVPANIYTSAAERPSRVRAHAEDPLPTPRRPGCLTS